MSVCWEVCRPFIYFTTKVQYTTFCLLGSLSASRSHCTTERFKLYIDSFTLGSLCRFSSAVSLSVCVCLPFSSIGASFRFYAQAIVVIRFVLIFASSSTRATELTFSLSDGILKFTLSARLKFDSILTTCLQGKPVVE